MHPSPDYLWYLGSLLIFGTLPQFITEPVLFCNQFILIKINVIGRPCLKCDETFFVWSMAISSTRKKIIKREIRYRKSKGNRSYTIQKIQQNWTNNDLQKKRKTIKLVTSVIQEQTDLQNRNLNALQHDLLSDKFMMHFKSIAIQKPNILEKQPPTYFKCIDLLHK